MRINQEVDVIGGFIIERDEIETAAGNSPKAVRLGTGRAQPASHQRSLSTFLPYLPTVYLPVPSILFFSSSGTSLIKLVSANILAYLSVFASIPL